MKATPILFLWWTLFSIPIAAQNKPQFTPYSPETSLIKLQKDYSFIKSIAPLDTALYSAEKDIVYKTVNQTALQLDIYAPKIKKDALLPAVLLVHGGGWASGSRVNQQRMAEAQ